MVSTDLKPMTSSTFNDELTMTTCYYIRKLLSKYTHQLRSIVAVGAGIVANSQCDINSVLESLYLEELEIQLMARELEVLVEIHRGLSAHKDATAGIRGQIAEVERRIFWILGFKKTETD